MRILGTALLRLLSLGLRSQQKKSTPHSRPSPFRFLLSALSSVLLITGLLSPTAFAAHPSGTPVPAGYVDAASFGYNTVDATFALQSAINSGQDVFVPNTGADWIVTPIFLTNSNQNILFEDGVVIQAKSTHFRGGNDSLFEARDVENVTMTGYGVTLRMRKDDYANSTANPPFPAAYAPSHEWRHGIDLEHVRNFEIKGFRIEDTGGDAIYVGSDGPDAFGGDYSENVLIQDVFINNAYRNGISVVSVENLTIDNAIITNTVGTDPQVGIDFEPNRSGQRIVNATVRNTIIVGSASHGIQWHLNNLSDDGASSTGLIENVTVSANIGDGLSMGPMPLLNWDIRDSLLIYQGDDGFDVDSGPGTQTIEYSAFFGNADTDLRGDVAFGTGTFAIGGTPPPSDFFVNTTDPTDPLYYYLKPSASTLITEGASDGSYIGARPVFLPALSASGSSVPEPSTAALLSLALAGLAAGRWRLR